jgi:hypothetical protein
MAESAKLTFFVSPAWRRDLPHSPLLYPFWRNVLDSNKVPFQHALFERYSFDTTKYDITDDPEKADLVFMPYSHNLVRQCAPELMEMCVAEAKKQNKFLLIDGVGDIEHPISAPRALVLRAGGYRFSRKENEIQVPFYADDLLEAYCGGQLEIRQKSEKAKVGFSGWASLTLVQELRALAKELPTRIKSIFDRRYAACRKGIFFRRAALKALRASPLVESDFLVRPTYSGHRNDAAGDQSQLRREFVENLLNNDYNLDIRGDANASIRLPEILSVGRIPVIIDTERNLPFSDVLDYSSFSLIVDFRKLPRLPQILADFHAGLSPEMFKTMQKNARDAYRNFFRVDALTGHVMDEVRKRAGL